LARLQGLVNVSAPIPDDALVMARVEVVQYVNGQGQVWWNIDHDDTATITQIFGLLHTAAIEMYLRAKGEA
jgi:hypothetical protein